MLVHEVDTYLERKEKASTWQHSIKDRLATPIVCRFAWLLTEQESDSPIWITLTIAEKHFLMLFSTFNET